MDKRKALDILTLLSALESWSFSTKTTMPDYLLERLCENVDYLRAQILGAKENE